MTEIDFSISTGTIYWIEIKPQLRTGKMQYRCAMIEVKKKR